MKKFPGDHLTAAHHLRRRPRCREASQTSRGAVDRCMRMLGGGHPTRLLRMPSADVAAGLQVRRAADSYGAEDLAARFATNVELGIPFTERENQIRKGERPRRL